MYPRFWYNYPSGFGGLTPDTDPFWHIQDFVMIIQVVLEGGRSTMVQDPEPHWCIQDFDIIQVVFWWVTFRSKSHLMYPRFFYNHQRVLGGKGSSTEPDLDPIWCIHVFAIFKNRSYFISRQVTNETLERP